MPEQPSTKRINVSITGEEAELLEQYQAKLNKELTLNLTIPQVVKRLIRQATAHN